MHIRRSNLNLKLSVAGKKSRVRNPQTQINPIQKEVLLLTMSENSCVVVDSDYLWSYLMSSIIIILIWHFFQHLIVLKYKYSILVSGYVISFSVKTGGSNPFWSLTKLFFDFAWLVLNKGIFYSFLMPFVASSCDNSDTPNIVLVSDID